MIDGQIVVTVLRVAGGGVRLGIEAPREVNIRREELPEHSGHQRPVRSPNLLPVGGARLSELNHGLAGHVRSA